MSDFESAEFDDELLSAYLDDELAPEERARVEERLAGDPRARQLLDELRAVSRTMKELPRATLGADLRETVLQRAERAMLVPGEQASARGLNEVVRRIPFGRSKRAWFWAAAALAAGLMLMVFEREPGRNQDLPAAIALKKSPPPLTVPSADKLKEEVVEVVPAPAESTPLTVATSGSGSGRADAQSGVGGSSAEMDMATIANSTGEDLLVVHVNVKPAALQNRAIDAVFARNSIEVDEPAADELESAAPSDVDVVLVEAAPAQVNACLAELGADPTNYFGIEVDDQFATNQQTPAAQQLAREMKIHNRGATPQRQKIALAPNNNLYYQTNRGLVEIDRYLVNEGADERGRARQLLRENTPGMSVDGRAVRIAPQATGLGYAASPDAAPTLGAETTNEYRQSATAPAGELYDQVNQDVTRRAAQKMAAKADMLQVLFILSASEEPVSTEPAASPTTSPPADDPVR